MVQPDSRVEMPFLAKGWCRLTGVASRMVAFGTLNPRQRSAMAVWAATNPTVTFSHVGMKDAHEVILYEGVEDADPPDA